MIYRITAVSKLTGERVTVHTNSFNGYYETLKSAKAALAQFTGTRLRWQYYEDFLIEVNSGPWEALAG